MQRLEVSSAVRSIKGSLGVKELKGFMKGLIEVSREFYSKTSPLYIINLYMLLFMYLIPCLQSSALVLLVSSTQRPRHTAHRQTELCHSDHNRYCLNSWGMLVEAIFFSNLGSFSAFSMQSETNYLVC